MHCVFVSMCTIEFIAIQRCEGRYEPKGLEVNRDPARSIENIFNSAPRQDNACDRLSYVYHRLHTPADLFRIGIWQNPRTFGSKIRG